MSDTQTYDASRDRQPREEVVATNRRRRRGGTLDRLFQFKLDCIEPDRLDLANYVYRWVNDEPGKLRMATKHDDYDFVQVHELGEDFDIEGTESESGARVRMLAGDDKHGNPMYTYLLKKPRQFWEEDNETMVERREAMMAGRVYNGDVDHDAADLGGEGRPGGDDKYYVPAGTQIGSAGRRKSGPIPRRLMKG